MSIDGGQLFLPGRENGKATLFRITLDSSTYAMRAGPEPVARWTGEQVGAALSPSGDRLATAVRTSGTRVFVFPFDVASGQVGVSDAQVVGPDEGSRGSRIFHLTALCSSTRCRGRDGRLNCGSGRL